MRALVLLLVAAIVCAAVSPPAAAQTRLSVGGGGIVPFGELGDTTDPSLAIGLRLEIQPTNALGQKRLLSVTLSGAYAALDPTSEHAIVLERQGSGSDSSLFLLDGGVRVYSAVAPFFVSAATGWTRFDAAGASEVADGAHVSAGLGFLTPVPFGTIEVEGRLTQVFLEQDQDFQILAVLLGMGLPF